jgi:hypothetical protein
MILPPGHHREITTRRQLSRAEKWIVGGVTAGLAILAVVIVVSFSGPSQTSAPGCVDVAILGATGAAAIHQCGANARALCRDAGQSASYTGEIARQIQTACRKDGYPVG